MLLSTTALISWSYCQLLSPRQVTSHGNIFCSLPKFCLNWKKEYEGGHIKKREIKFLKRKENGKKGQKKKVGFPFMNIYYWMLTEILLFTKAGKVLEWFILKPNESLYWYLNKKQ